MSDDHEFRFPEEMEAEDMKLILGGLSELIKHGAEALQSGMVQPDGPRELIEDANRFQIQLLRANPEFAEELLEEAEEGEGTIVGGSVEEFKAVILDEKDPEEVFNKSEETPGYY